MRRAFYFSVAAILALFTACQKERAGKVFVFTIDASALYSELNITEEVGRQLNSGSGVIVDSIYVYGASGALVSRTGAQSAVIQPVSVNLSGLLNGEYTMVAVQYFKANNNAPVWFASDANKLSSLSIQHTNTSIDCFLALGVETKTITVNNGTYGTTVMPKAAGSIVDFQLDGYVKGPYDYYDLPPVWLYGDQYCSGICPGKTVENYWVIVPEQPEIIGSLEEGQSHRKYFTLMNGAERNLSIRLVSDGYISKVFFQDKLSLSPGFNMVCYYNFDPDTFYCGYFGTPEGAAAFKMAQSGCDGVFFPSLQWGISKAEVEKYVSDRTHETVLNGQLTVKDNGSILKYNLVPGLTELYSFNNADATDLARVTFSYEGRLSLEKVKSSMEMQGYKTLGWTSNGALVTTYYLSPDGQTELTITPNSDIIEVPKGDNFWTASFFPVRQEDLDALSQ